jgi:hypothetical protein
VDTASISVSVFGNDAASAADFATVLIRPESDTATVADSATPVVEGQLLHPRVFTVDPESRTTTVQLDDRVVVVELEGRLTIVGADDRTIRIEAEDRTTVVPFAR